MNRNLIRQISDYIFEIPADAAPGMKVPARIYASEKLVREMDNAVFRQIVNVTTLPGITGRAPQAIIILEEVTVSPATSIT